MPVIGIQPQANPLNELRGDKLLLSKGEYVSLAANAEQDLLNVSGPGCVSSIWMALPGSAAPQPAIDGRLRVYYDGSSTPSIDFDMGTLFAAHYGAGQASGADHKTPHMQFQLNSGNGNMGWMIRFPAPFGTSIRVTYLAPNNVANPIFWMVAYSLYGTDRANGLRLRGYGLRLSNQATVTAAQTYNLIPVGAITGGPGSLLWHSYVAGIGATNLTWLERNFAITVDGESSPSIVSSGTEDWFDSAWYYNGWSDFSSGFYSYVGGDIRTPNIVSQATDFLGKWGGIPFNSSVSMVLATEAVCTTGHSFGYTILYYQ
jgi:hypothetical protein